MSPHTATAALRAAAAVRLPVRGVGPFGADQLVVFASASFRGVSTQLGGRRSFSSQPGVVCLQCSTHIRTRLQHQRLRFYSVDRNKPAPESEESGPVIELGPPPSHTPSSPLSSFSPPPAEETPVTFTETTPESSVKDEAKPADQPDTLKTEPTQTTEQDPGEQQQNEPLKASLPEAELPSQSERTRHPWSTKFSHFMDNLQSRVIVATQTLNDLTGYSAIEAIKARNANLEKELDAAQERLRAARQNYKSLTSHRAATQREVTTLLARKDTWNPMDLERFTTLYRADHEMEAQVANASAELTEAETDESKLSAELNAGILKRYHEEQIWSDHIRRQSTWGTWGLMGVNILLFIVFQFVAEPWRRKRLIKGVVEGEQRMIEEVRQELGEVRAALEATQTTITQARSTQPTEIKPAEDGVETETPVTPADAPLDSAAFAATQTGGEEEKKMELAEDEIKEVVEEIITPAERQKKGSSRWDWSWDSLRGTVSDGNALKAAVSDLYSERRIDITMRDALILAVESAVTGAAVAAGLAFVLLRRT
ncbi:Mdm33 family-domain-containing protein [Diplogelasinospora grovesii]|uniref:Sensitive to high expression protein 9, mitochondrial n=1 Tax=Diplogelasinospora grovesii TaxID=303347 RepID=A0AAN6NCN0_9PEZI|nr:Mdm33 family-domain-containing protein [Diplogelasinospora grovesii]